MEQVYQQKDKRVRIFNQSNKGAGLARNTALNNATGEFVVFMDSDDRYSSDGSLELLYTTAIKNKVSICGGLVASLGDPEFKIKLNSLIPYFQKEGLTRFDEYQRIGGFQSYIYSLDLLNSNGIRFKNYSNHEDLL